jgi:transketolase
MPTVDPTRLIELQEIANEVRKLVLKQVYSGKGGHVGGPLSAADILTVLYFHTMRIDPKNPAWEERDRFVLSKGHSTNALYAVLALRGFFTVDELYTFHHINSRLQAHPDMTKTPGIDMSSGSLGQGISAALGMALAARFLGKKFHIYTMIGDGESQEGQVWEAAFIASRYAVDNLTVFLDNNKIQQYGWLYPTSPEKLPPIDNPADKFQAFGWHTIEIDGHDIAAIIAAIDEAHTVKRKPTMIIANTTKGKGVSFMEGTYAWHTRVPTDEELEQAIKELDHR